MTDYDVIDDGTHELITKELSRQSLPWTWFLCHVDDVAAGMHATWIERENRRKWRPAVITGADRGDTGILYTIHSEELLTGKKRSFVCPTADADLERQKEHAFIAPSHGDFLLVVGWRCSAVECKVLEDVPGVAYEVIRARDRRFRRVETIDASVPSLHESRHPRWRCTEGTTTYLRNMKTGETEPMWFANTVMPRSMLANATEERARQWANELEQDDDAGVDLYRGDE